jgi:hypothetical protein
VGEGEINPLQQWERDVAEAVAAGVLSRQACGGSYGKTTGVYFTSLAAAVREPCQACICALITFILARLHQCIGHVGFLRPLYPLVYA